jgi:hypothetical protein
MNKNNMTFTDEANEMHAGAAEYEERAEVLAMLAKEDEQEAGWRMLGIERPE